MAQITISPMAAVYGDLVKKGKKTFGQVPEKIIAEVKQYLIQNGYESLILEATTE